MIPGVVHVGRLDLGAVHLEVDVGAARDVELLEGVDLRGDVGEGGRERARAPVDVGHGHLPLLAGAAAGAASRGAGEQREAALVEPALQRHRGRVGRGLAAAGAQHRAHSRRVVAHGVIPCVLAADAHGLQPQRVALLRHEGRRQRHLAGEPQTVCLGIDGEGHCHIGGPLSDVDAAQAQRLDVLGHGLRAQRRQRQRRDISFLSHDGCRDVRRGIRC